jgi:hypothetical protein
LRQTAFEPEHVLVSGLAAIPAANEQDEFSPSSAIFWKNSSLAADDVQRVLKSSPYGRFPVVLDGRVEGIVLCEEE